MWKFNDNIEIYSSECYNVDSDKEYSYDPDEKNSDGKIWIKKSRCINLFLEKNKKNIINLLKINK